jgi:tetratricopeptide (TPR) repeat protein
VAVAGAPLYMAPEQLAGQPATAATDVFGFSVTLYEVLYEQHPFADPDTPAADRRARVMAGQVRLPPGRGVPGHVQRLVLAGLAADPAVRPADMGAIAAALLEDPARRRRRAGALAAAAAVVAAAFWVGGYLRADPARRCHAGAAVMDALWSPQRRQQLGSGHQGAAAAAWQLVARRFDAYAGSWRDMFSDTCRAAFTDRRLSGELLDLRMNCLDGHRASFAAVVGASARASARELQKVAAAPLPPVAECGLSEQLSGKPLPADPASRRQIASVNEQLAQVDAARTLGDFARARRLATEAAAAARRLGYQPLEARALNKLAAVELRGIKLAAGTAGAADTPGAPGAPASQGADRAMALLEQAIAVAEAGRDDASRAEAAVQLAQAHRNAGRLAEAERWLERAAAIVQRIGDPPLYLSSLDLARGWVQYDRQQWEAARASFARSLRLRQQLLGPRAPEVLSSKAASCGVVPRDQREKCHRESIALAQTIGGPRHPDLATMKGSLAYFIVDDASKHAEACQLASEAVDVERDAVETNHLGFLRAMLTRGQCLRDEGRAEEAHRIYRQAIGYATHPTAVRGDLLQDYGAFLSISEDNARAIDYWRQAIATFEQVYGPAHLKPIEVRHWIADNLRRQGKLVEALKEADTGIAICDQQGAMPFTYPDLYMVKGLTLSKMNRREPAYQALRRSVELHDEVGTPEWNRAFAIEALAEMELELGKLDEAIAHLERVMKVWTFEADPVYHGAAALVMANAVAKQGGRASWPRACELARRTLTGYTQPSGRTLTKEIAETKKFLLTHRCGGDG